MDDYEEPIVEDVSLDDDDDEYDFSEDCTVVCTYMYGYCGDDEGWGTTYCPDWGDGLEDIEDEEDEDD